MSKRTRKPFRASKKQEPEPSAKDAQVVADCDLVTPNVESSPRPRLWRMHLPILLVLLGLCAGLYSWTTDFPMVFDDHTYLIDNPIFRDASNFNYMANFTEFARLPAKLGTDPDYAVNFILRPVSYATFYWNQLFDGFTPRWFRVVNIVIHALNALLVYAVVFVVLRRSAEQGTLSASSRWFIAATSALLFSAHPLAIESVTYIIQRFTSMVLLFSLLSLWLYFLSLSAVVRRHVWMLRAGSVIALLLAMQTKEDAFMVPFLAVLIDWLVRGQKLKKACLAALPLLLCAPLIPVLVLMTAAAQSGGFNLDASLNIVNSREEPLDHWHYIVTQITVVAHYLRLMVWPTGLNLDPEWPIYTSIWQAPVLKSLSVLASVLALMVWMFARHRGDVRMRAAFAFTLWYFINVSVSSGLVPLPDMMAEHRSYMPSVGIFIAASCLLDRLRLAAFWNGLSLKLAPTGMVLAVVALSWATCARNEVWRTNESLWQDTVAKSPGKFRTWGNLGTAYSIKGREEKAVDCYRKALEIEPKFQNGLLNLSNSLLRLNRPKESLDTTIQLIKLDEGVARKPPVAFTLGLGLAGVGRYDEAVGIFREILAVMPDDPMTHKALGLVYHETGLTYRALDHYRRAIRLMPGDTQLQGMIAAVEAEIARKRGHRLQ